MDGHRSEGSPPRMTSVTGAETVEDPSPVEVCNRSSASLEMTQRVSKERIHTGCEKGGSCDLSHEEGLQPRSLHLSPQEQSAHHQDRRQAWRRASMKGMNRRKSLPPFHQGITDVPGKHQEFPKITPTFISVPERVDLKTHSQKTLCKLSRSISVDLAESKRLGLLLLSSFQFSVQKLEPFLKDTEGFSLESFRAKASSLSEELKHFTDGLESNGTLQKCFEDSKGKASDLSLETSVAEMKEYITKFSLERQTWDQLLLQYQKEAEEIISRESTETKITEVEVEPTAYLTSSQNEVLNTKPDYQNILQSQNKVFDCVELLMDELQGSVKQLHAFMDESTHCFQKMSVQLGKKSTQQLDYSPARKLLKLQLRNLPTTHCSKSCQ